MNKQRVFEFVTTFLASQGKPASNDKGSCFYRTKDDNGKTLKCAAGCLIPDNVYYEAMEGENVRDLEYFQHTYPEMLDMDRLFKIQALYPQN